MPAGAECFPYSLLLFADQDVSIQLTVYDEDKFGNPTMLGATHLSLPPEDINNYVGQNVIMSNCLIPTSQVRENVQC